MLDNKTLNKEQLLMKSEGARDCAEWIKKKIKEEQNELKKEQDDERGYGMYEDCGQFYRDLVTKREGRIEVLVETKISLEKYMKLLMHMSDEKEI